jgi:poly(A) polymerase
LHAALHGDVSGRWRNFVNAGLAGGDERVAADRPVTPTFLFATLLYPAIDALAQRRHPGLAHTSSAFGQALGAACDEIASAQVKRIAIPKRFTLPLRELLVMQPKFERRDGKRMLMLLNHPRFRAAYDLFLLRAECGLADMELAKFWTDVQLVAHDERIEMALALGTTPHAPSAGHSTDAAGAADEMDGEAGDEPGAEGTPAKRRRRRRIRRPRGEGGGPADG